MVESFLKYVRFEKRFSPHTVLSYQTDLQQFGNFLKQTYSEKKPELANYGMVRSWIVQLVESGRNPSSINRKIACLRSFYKFLLKGDVITKDPMVKIRVLKTKKRLPHFVKENDMVELLDKTAFTADHAGLRDRLILELFYGTGMRLSELINLKESQINLRGRTVKVLGKRNKERVIPFLPGLVSIIEAYCKARRKEVKKEVGSANHNYLLVTDEGEQLYPMMVYRLVKKYLNKFTSVDKRSPHVLRHTYATHLMNKGAEINALKDLLGHTSLAATQVYTHNSMDKLKKVFDQAHPKA
jgi:integrase/recombinase XerC